MLVSGFLDQLDCARHVAAVGDADRNHDACNRIRKRPVQQSAGYKLLVGYEQFLLVPATNCSGTDADLGDYTICFTHGNHVTDPDRALEQQDNSANKISHDFLQAEADTDAQCSD